MGMVVGMVSPGMSSMLWPLDGIDVAVVGAVELGGVSADPEHPAASARATGTSAAASLRRVMRAAPHWWRVVD